MVRRISTIRRLRRLPEGFARLATLGVACILTLAATIGVLGA